LKEEYIRSLTRKPDDNPKQGSLELPSKDLNSSADPIGKTR
jgi:hypothetical protein